MARRAKSRISWRAGALVASCGCALFALVTACLPELSPLPPVTNGDGAATRTIGCGDGVIQSGVETCDPGDASSRGCAKCQIECAGGAVGKNGHCYFVVGNEATKANALAACRVQGAHLVTFASDEEVALVDTLVDRSLGYWVGLFASDSLKRLAYAPAKEDEPGFPQLPFSGPCPGCFGLDASGEEALPFSDLFSGPDAAVRGCIIARAWKWELVPCAVSPASFQTVCEREPVGQRTQTCDGGVCFTVHGIEGKRYLIDPVERTAEEGARACRDHGGQAVVFASREEREGIARAIMEGAPPEDIPRDYWIGAVDDGGTWVWEDGKELDARPPPWGDKQGAPLPGGRAYMRILLAAYDTQLAFAGGPDERHATICERP